MSLTLNINSASDISLTEMLKKFFNEEAEILIKTDAETEVNFEEKTDLTKKLT